MHRQVVLNAHYKLELRGRTRLSSRTLVDRTIAVRYAFR